MLNCLYQSIVTFKVVENTISASPADASRQTILDADNLEGEMPDIDPAGPAPGKFDEEIYRKEIIAEYLRPLKSDQPDLQLMVEIARRAKEAGVKVVFFVHPVNWEVGEKYLGSDFSGRLRDNVSMVRSMLEREGYSLLDLSRILGAEGFISRDQIGVHINDKGKAALAEALAGRVKAELGQNR